MNLPVADGSTAILHRAGKTGIMPDGTHSDSAESRRGGGAGAMPPPYLRRPAKCPSTPMAPPPNFGRPSPVAPAGGSRRGAPASQGRGRGCSRNARVPFPARQGDLCRSAHCIETHAAFDSHMSRVHGAYRGRRGKYVRLRSPSPTRRTNSGPSARVPRVAPGPPRTVPPRPSVPEAARTPPIGLGFVTLGPLHCAYCM